MKTIIGTVLSGEDLSLQGVSIPDTPIPIVLDFDREIGQATLWVEGNDLMAKLNLNEDVEEPWQAIVGFSEDATPLAVTADVSGQEHDQTYIIGGSITNVAILTPERV